MILERSMRKTIISPWVSRGVMRHMSGFFLHPGPAADSRDALLWGAWFRSTVFFQDFLHHFFPVIFRFSHLVPPIFWNHGILMVSIRLWGPTVGFLQTWQLQDLSMLVWGNKLESDYQCGGPGWTRKETRRSSMGFFCIFTVPTTPAPDFAPENVGKCSIHGAYGRRIC